MGLVLQTTLTCGEGAYATVFLAGDLAIKVFKRRRGDPPGHTLAVFEDEVVAWEAATKNQLPVPSFFGPQVVSAILGPNREDCSVGYHLAYNYAMEHISTPFQGKGLSEALESRFRAAGINHTSDAEFALDKNGEIRYVIDFAMEEHELFVTD